MWIAIGVVIVLLALIGALVFYAKRGERSDAERDMLIKGAEAHQREDEERQQREGSDLLDDRAVLARLKHNSRRLHRLFKWIS